MYDRGVLYLDSWGKAYHHQPHPGSVAPAFNPTLLHLDASNTLPRGVKNHELELSLITETVTLLDVRQSLRAGGHSGNK